MNPHNQRTSLTIIIAGDLKLVGYLQIIKYTFFEYSPLDVEIKVENLNF